MQPGRPPWSVVATGRLCWWIVQQLAAQGLITVSGDAEQPCSWAGPRTTAPPLFPLYLTVPNLHPLHFAGFIAGLVLAWAPGGLIDRGAKQVNPTAPLPAAVAHHVVLGGTHGD